MKKKFNSIIIYIHTQKKKKKKMFEKLKKNLSTSTFKKKFELFQNFSIDQSRFSLLHRTSYNLLSPKPNLKGKRNDFFSRHKTLRLESSLCTWAETRRSPCNQISRCANHRRNKVKRQWEFSCVSFHPTQI